jgi:hypothetical protein
MTDIRPRTAPSSHPTWRESLVMSLRVMAVANHAAALGVVVLWRDFALGFFILNVAILEHSLAGLLSLRGRR